jgi:glycosyltransferase involved in cell wall biosynthesis
VGCGLIKDSEGFIDKLLILTHGNIAGQSWPDMEVDKVDVVIPSLGRMNDSLLKRLERMPGSGKVIVTTEKPLSLARKRAVLQAKTEWVAMVDDDMVLPKDWLARVTAEIDSNVGAVATVALQGNKHVASYDRMVGKIVKLHKVDTSPHINNVLIRRSLMGGYDPPPLFFGEDHHLKKFIEKSGYAWKVIPYVGAVHLGSSKNHITLGVAYRRYGHYSLFQLARRMVARFIFTPYAALANFSFATFVYLNKINVEFITGWTKEFVRE